MGILPRARRYALDRTPTLQEIQEIIEAADVMGKALIFVLISSVIREATIEYFKILDYNRIERDGNLVAGCLIVYNGDPERYKTIIIAETCSAVDKYLAFRTEHPVQLALILHYLETNSIRSKGSTATARKTRKSWLYR